MTLEVTPNRQGRNSSGHLHVWRLVSALGRLSVCRPAGEAGGLSVCLFHPDVDDDDDDVRTFGFAFAAPRFVKAMGA